jgi:glycosyltransferase involved in cell wall biosynthesis
LSPRIAVLISTFNGEAWLAAQLDSLLAQRGVSLEVFARDDGSSDGTLAILAGYARHWPALAAPLTGDNLGPAASFLTLLAAVPGDFDAYAFCDQDDVWLPDKLARAAQHLAEIPGAALYCSRVMCVDAALRAIGPAPIKNDTRFEALLFENIAFGVTVVMNPAAAGLVRERLPARGAIIMHDWWCALVISALGRVTYDPEPGVLYRQHGGNQIGQTIGKAGEIVRLTRMFLRAPKRFWPVRAQAAELVRLRGEALKPADRALAETFVASRRSLRSRLAYALTGKVTRTDLMWVLAARTLIALGLY